MTKKRGRCRSWTILRSESPASNRPVHWMRTRGRLPPKCKPAAKAMASPSRQTRRSCKRVAVRRAGSQRPISLSGIHTTCVTPQSSRAATTEGPSNMIVPQDKRTLKRARLRQRPERGCVNTPSGGLGALTQPRSPICSITQPRSPICSITQPRSPICSITQPRSPICSITQPRSPTYSIFLMRLVAVAAFGRTLERSCSVGFAGEGILGSHYQGVGASFPILGIALGRLVLGQLLIILQQLLLLFLAGLALDHLLKKAGFPFMGFRHDLFNVVLGFDLIGGIKHAQTGGQAQCHHRHHKRLRCTHSSSLMFAEQPFGAGPRGATFPCLRRKPIFVYSVI